MAKRRKQKSTGRPVVAEQHVVEPINGEPDRTVTCSLKVTVSPKNMAKRRKQKSNGSPVVAEQQVAEPISGESARKVTVPPKVCRLCKTKDGPFLNIFGGEKIIAKKIDDLMPFEIAENDELPHNICFRCSAKVEELHEFVQKCINTQNELGTDMGLPFSLVLKSKRDRFQWEEKLNKSNITNDDICNAAVKKAIEGMQDLKKPAMAEKEVSGAKSNTKPSSHTPAIVDPTMLGEKVNNRLSLSANATTVGENSCNERSVTAIMGVKSYPKPKSKHVNNKTVRSDIESFLSLASNDSNTSSIKIKTVIIEDETCEKTDTTQLTRSLRSRNSNTVIESEVVGATSAGAKIKNVESKNNSTISDKSENTSCHQNVVKNDVVVEKAEATSKPFNIMDHVSTIKVNGVGVLFQCKICNRNFLKKEMVLTHWCAKNGVPKENFTKTILPPDPPRVPNIKYINTNTDGSITGPNKSVLKTQQILGSKVTEDKHIPNSEEVKSIDARKRGSEIKPKPKIGPASKVKRPPDESFPTVGTVLKSPVLHPPTNNDSVHNPAQLPMSTVNCRYKLVPGPNNTFTLLEAEGTQKEQIHKQFVGKKRKINEDNQMSIKNVKIPEMLCDTADTPLRKTAPIKDPKQPSVNQPYPVGLIKTVSRPGTNSALAVPAPFTTSAQKKQSYTIVQTGNPNKLLISAKPQPPVQEPVTKRQKKKTSVQQSSGQPYSITLEENEPKDATDFFTFINVDPLLQPSYVLPTDTILQESHISTAKGSSKFRRKFK